MHEPKALHKQHLSLESTKQKHLKHQLLLSLACQQLEHGCAYPPANHDPINHRDVSEVAAQHDEERSDDPKQYQKEAQEQAGKDAVLESCAIKEAALC